MLRLDEVMEGLTHLTTGVLNASTREITGITCDSRRVEPGFVFAAIPGTQLDGRRFIPDALARGAVAVLGPPGTETGVDHPDVSVITDDDPRRLYALMAARFFETQPKTIAAVTGTSGKTSTAHFLRQIWNQQGWPAAAMGTLGLKATDAGGEELVPGDGKALTTPDAADLHRQLRQLVELGVDHLVVEASSHGLDQRRLDGVRVSAAAFTNLSHDHLDYHGDEGTYLQAKLRLFRYLLVDGGAAVVNADQPYAETVVAACRARGLPVLRFGENGDRLRLVSRRPRADGQDIVLDVDGARHEVPLQLVGGFQASNAMCALGMAMVTGASADAAVGGLGAFRGAPGRMQLIGSNSVGASVYVDYAHKPDALRAALEALRPHTENRLIVVFGCGGDRDRTKRPVMGGIAAACADAIFITDDNPRSEEPSAIRNAIMSACPDAVEIRDRRAAIAAALDDAGAGDVVLVAGKGHETGQIVGDQVLPFNDAAEIHRLIGVDA
ncbi:MAG: UDP-N-acetylmuramoyl-L-alanyl-D-glutamate--2,6-diaminopimelate ligase [Rhodospirillaceae bacterium]